jgi:hypothetical protein
MLGRWELAAEALMSMLISGFQSNQSTLSRHSERIAKSNRLHCEKAALAGYPAPIGYEGGSGAPNFEISMPQGKETRYL